MYHRIKFGYSILLMLIALTTAGCMIARGPAHLPQNNLDALNSEKDRLPPGTLLDTAANIAKKSALEVILLLIVITVFWRLKFPAQMLDKHDSLYGDIVDLKGAVDHKEWHFDEFDS